MKHRNHFNILFTFSYLKENTSHLQMALLSYFSNKLCCKSLLYPIKNEKVPFYIYLLGTWELIVSHRKKGMFVWECLSIFWHNNFPRHFTLNRTDFWEIVPLSAVKNIKLVKGKLKYSKMLSISTMCQKDTVSHMNNDQGSMRLNLLRHCNIYQGQLSNFTKINFCSKLRHSICHFWRYNRYITIFGNSSQMADKIRQHVNLSTTTELYITLTKYSLL